MARNFGGLGLAFEVEDDGAVKKTEDFSSSIESLWTNVQKAGSAAMSAGRTIGTGLGKIGRVGTRGVGGVTSAIGSMIQSAMDPQLSTAYESMYAGFNKTFSAMTSGMNIAAQESKKMRKIIGSAAFALNEDMESTAKTWLVFRQQNVDLTKVMGARGIKGAIKDLIKVVSVYGVEGEQLGIVMTGLVKGFNMTEENVGALADKMFITGKHFNIGREAIQAWPAIFESLNQELADFGRRASPKDIEQLSTSIVGLGGALLQSLGGSAQASLEVARNVFTTVMAERKGIKEMAQGMKGDIGEFTLSLGEAAGDVGTMFQMIQADPLKFMTMLRELAKKAETEGGTMGVTFQRLSTVINRALGPNVTFAMKGNWDKVEESIAQVPALMDSPETKGAFARFAKNAHKTGLTTQERWDRMVESMRMKLFKLSGQNINTWMNQMQAGFKKTIDTLGGLAGDKGVIGDITRRILAVQKVGLSALIPGLESAAPLFSSLATSMLPVMTAMGSMGLSFGGLGKMLLPGGIFFAGLQVLKYGPEKAIERALGFIKKLDKHFGGALTRMKDNAIKWISSLQKVDWAKAFGKLIGTGKVLAGYIGPVLRKAIRAVDWKTLGKQALLLMKETFVGLTGMVSEVFTSMFAGNEKVISRGFEQLQEPIKAGFSTALFKAGWWVIDNAYEMLSKVGEQFWGYVFSSESIGEAMDKVVEVATLGFAGLFFVFKGFRTRVLASTKMMFTEMRVAYSTGMGTLRGVARVGAIGIKSAFSILKTVPYLFAFEAVISFYQTLKEESDRAAKHLAGPTADELKRGFDRVAKAKAGATLNMIDDENRFANFIRKISMGMADARVNDINETENAWEHANIEMTLRTSEFWTNVKYTWGAVIDTIKAVADKGNDIWYALMKAMSKSLDWFIAGAKVAWDNLGDLFQPVVDSLLDTWDDAIFKLDAAIIGGLLNIVEGVYSKLKKAEEFSDILVPDSLLKGLEAVTDSLQQQYDVMGLQEGEEKALEKHRKKRIEERKRERKEDREARKKLEDEYAAAKAGAVEAWGGVGKVYDAIENKVDAIWKQRGMGLEDWGDYLREKYGSALTLAIGGTTKTQFQQLSEEAKKEWRKYERDAAMEIQASEWWKNIQARGEKGKISEEKAERLFAKRLTKRTEELMKEAKGGPSARTERTRSSAKTSTPSVEQRADRRVEKEMKEPLTEMAYQQAHLHEAMSGFFKKPLDVQVKIVGDVKKFLKTAEVENRNLSNAKVI